MLRIAYSPIYKLQLPEGHRFPMIKYELIPEQLVYEGVICENNFFCPETIDNKWLLKAHDKEYIDKLNNLALSKSEVRKTGFPLSIELINREYTITEGTRKCVDYAIKFGAAANIAGGTHHSFRDRGEGFCLLNDIAVSSYYAIQTYAFENVLIIDLDVHQGNGTASIMQNESKVFTFSMHGKKNYPFKKEKSNLDIELDDGINDLKYLKLLKENLSKLWHHLKPDIIFYISGVDILSTDKLGRLNITRNGCRTRDELVYEYAQKDNIPIVTSMGGGYSEKIYDIVEAHCNTFKAMSEITD
jgi:acetoin utilization deacetylase AcuC-like enzyme